MSSDPKRLTLSIDKCPHGVFAIAVNEETHGAGTRLTSSKCCGRWNRVTAWPITPERMLEIARILTDEAEACE